VADTIVQRLEKYTSPEPNSGCWLWDGAADPNGYGRIRINKRTKLTHRVSYAERRGAIADDVCVLHKCNVPACINPDHLYLGDRADNWRDTIASGHVSYGDKHPDTKLSEKDAAYIRQSREQGRVLARRFRVSEALVSMIRRSQKRTIRSSNCGG
jgi:hypothetical protein